MDWLQVLTISGSTIGACWFMYREFTKELVYFRSQWAQESKDFHGRLCALEEKYIQMMERHLEVKEENKTKIILEELRRK